MTMLLNLRIVFGVMAFLFFVLSIFLFIKFDIKSYFYIYMKHSGKNYGSDKTPVKSTKKKKTYENKGKAGEKTQLLEQTEKLSEETVLLTEQGEETEVLSEEQLQFVTMKSVEVYSDK